MERYAVNESSVFNKYGDGSGGDRESERSRPESSTVTTRAVTALVLRAPIDWMEVTNNCERK